MKTSIILLAAGSGKRFGEPKCNAKLAGKTLLQWNLELLKKLPFQYQLIVITKGGKTRHESVKIGLKKAMGDIVIIHNVANPLVSEKDFIKIREYLLKHNAACFMGQKIVDTVRELQNGKSRTIPRENLWRVQTPQGFRIKTLIYALKNARAKNITDEIMLFEKTTTPIIAFETSALNQKITYQRDLEIMEKYLSNEMRVGIGEDSHLFDRSGMLVLSGVKISKYPKLKANSDGDVILHALCNALRSAVGQGSFSKIADPMCKQGIFASSQYLKKIIREVYKKSWQINNLGINVECIEPKIDPLVPVFKKSLSKLLNLNVKKIGITATSGREKKCIRCQCIISIAKF